MKNKSKTPFSLSAFISRRGTPGRAVAPTRSSPKAFRTSMGRLWELTCYILSEIHENPLPRGVTGLTP